MAAWEGAQEAWLFWAGRGGMHSSTMCGMPHISCAAQAGGAERQGPSCRASLPAGLQRIARPLEVGQAVTREGVGEGGRSGDEESRTVRMGG